MLCWDIWMKVRRHATNRGPGTVQVYNCLLLPMVEEMYEFVAYLSYIGFFEDFILFLFFLFLFPIVPSFLQMLKCDKYND